MNIIHNVLHLSCFALRLDFVDFGVWYWQKSDAHSCLLIGNCRQNTQPAKATFLKSFLRFAGLQPNGNVAVTLQFQLTTITYTHCNVASALQIERCNGNFEPKLQIGRRNVAIGLHAKLLSCSNVSLISR